MIRAFGLDNACLISVDETNPTLLNDAIWIDLIDPSEAERTVLENRLDQTLAEERELEDLEASARFFEDEDGLHLHSFFYCLDDDDYADMPLSPSLFVTGVCLPCVIGIYPHFACIECVPAVRN